MRLRVGLRSSGQYPDAEGLVQPFRDGERDETRAIRAGAMYSAQLVSLTLADIVVDLDETLWDWCFPLSTQRLLSHREYVFVRDPLVRLLEGIGGGHLNVWTAGYGYRIDRICERRPDLAALFGLHADRGDTAEAAPNIVTRLDFLRALERAPDVIPQSPRVRERWVAQKIVGMPTRAGKPAIDAARVLVDDRETNCRRFVAAGGSRSALWLRGTPRVWKDNLPLRGVRTPPAHSWAPGAADALHEIDRGKVGLFVIDPQHSDQQRSPIELRLPHAVVWRDWLGPGRRVRDLLRAHRRDALEEGVGSPDVCGQA